MAAAASFEQCRREIYWMDGGWRPFEISFGAQVSPSGQYDDILIGGLLPRYTGLVIAVQDGFGSCGPLEEPRWGYGTV